MYAIRKAIEISYIVIVIFIHDHHYHHENVAFMGTLTPKEMGLIMGRWMSSRPRMGCVSGAFRLQGTSRDTIPGGPDLHHPLDGSPASFGALINLCQSSLDHLRP